MQVLLVESDDLDHNTSLLSSLETDGHQVFLAHTPDIAVQKILNYWPNLVIFNPAQGYLDLADFQQVIAETNLDVPWIVVGNKDQLSASMSHDTILIAPNKLQHLSQSMEKATLKQKNRFLRLPDLIIDCQRYKILRNGRNFSLTPKEFRLLYLLVDHRDQVLKRKTIMQEVWETDYMGDTRTLDVHIRWLREKIEENPSQPRHLITVRGIGYRFITSPESD
jgi:DNA-binding response OmpR family regulator